VASSTDILLEGDFGWRRVVGPDGGIVVKLRTLSLHDRGRFIPFVGADTIISALKALGSYNHKKTYIVMARLSGHVLLELILKISVDWIKVIAAELKLLLDQLWVLR
jgi:hypothetical protein